MWVINGGDWDVNSPPASEEWGYLAHLPMLDQAWHKSRPNILISLRFHTTSVIPGGHWLFFYKLAACSSFLVYAQGKSLDMRVVSLIHSLIQQVLKVYYGLANILDM